MLCEGTAWSQVRQIDPKKLTDPNDGVEHLLNALSSWEETTELKTFELFEKALYKATQQNDEASHSYVLRLQAAFDDLGDKATLQEMQASILLRQSGLTNEDKKRALSMTNGELNLKSIEQAMRKLSTRVLFSAGETKKKIYPTNYVEPDEAQPHVEDEGSMHSTYHALAEEEDTFSSEAINALAQAGDEDAMMIQQFERDFEDMMQDVPDLQHALVSYQAARNRINKRRRSRGLWPRRGKVRASIEVQADWPCSKIHFKRRSICNV